MANDIGVSASCVHGHGDARSNGHPLQLQLRPQLLEESQAVALNDLVESLFGVIDQFVSSTSTKNGVSSIQTHAMSRTVAYQQWWDELNEVEQQQQRENAKLKAPDLIKRNKAAAAAATEQRRVARETKAWIGKASEVKATQKDSQVTLNTINRITSVKELEEQYLECRTCALKDALLTKELEVYKVSYGKLKVIDRDGEIKLLQQSFDDDGWLWWQKTRTVAKVSQKRSRERMYSNLGYLIMWMEDVQADKRDRNPKKLIKRGGRASKQIPTSEAAASANEGSELTKIKAGFAKFAKGVATIRSDGEGLVPYEEGVNGPEGWVRFGDDDSQLYWKPPPDDEDL
jgi:hypothetical protein